MKTKKNKKMLNTITKYQSRKFHKFQIFVRYQRKKPQTASQLGTLLKLFENDFYLFKMVHL